MLIIFNTTTSITQTSITIHFTCDHDSVHCHSVVTDNDLIICPTSCIPLDR